MIKEVVEKKDIYKILNLLFGRIPVYILDNGREYPIKVISLKPNGLVISHNRNIQSGERILILNHNGMRFTTYLQYLGGDKQSSEVLIPVKVQIQEAKRQNNRIEGDNFSPKIQVVHTLNQNEIQKAQGFNDENVDRILSKFKSKLKTKFDYANIYYSSRLDNRLRLMQNYDKPIFIPNRREPNSVPKTYFPYEEYSRLIQVVKLEDRFVSEITIPIKYKHYTSLGYVQVLGENPLNESSYETIYKVSDAISKEIISTGIFQESKEVCEVSDLSRTGLSFLHPQSRLFSRSFSVGEVILFELHLPDGGKAMMRSVIKNIKNMETNFRVGVEFYNLTLLDYKVIESYLEKEA